MNTMKKLMKSFAMFTLSACILMGGALSSFAAAAPVVTIQSHQASSCKGTDRAEIVAQFTDAEGNAASYTICAECGKVNGKSVLTQMDNTVANLQDFKAYQGDLDNGQRIMTISCLTSGYAAMQNMAASVMMPRSSIDGYDLYLVNLDGTQSKLDVYGSDDWAHVDVYMADGAALICMVPQA